MSSVWRKGGIIDKMPQESKHRSHKGMGSIRQRTVTRKDGTQRTYWEGRITKGFDPKTGKPITVSISGKTKREVTQRMQATAVELNEGTYVAPSKLTVAEWMDIWLKEYQGSKKPLTISNYAQTINKHIKPALGKIQLKNLSNLQIQRFYNSLSKGESPLAPKSVKNLHGILHKALDQAVIIGELKTNPSTGCIMPKQTQKEITPLEPEEITRFIENLKDESYRTLFLMAIFTGMRQGELLGLSWDDVDLENGIVNIRRQLQCLKGHYFLQTPKHDKLRMIAPPRLVMDALAEEKKTQDQWKALFAEQWKNEWNLVFTDPFGKHLVRRTVDKHYKKILQACGIEDHRFHDIRHTFAVSMLDAGEDFKTLQENLGHASAAFTLNQYAHVSKRMMLQTSQKMNDYFEKLMPKVGTEKRG